MLRLSGLDNFYCLPLLHDMRYKGPRLSEIIRNVNSCIHRFSPRMRR